MRTRIITAVLVAAVAVVGVPVAAAALPNVDMEAVLKAAQIDPRRADSAITPGSEASVKLVESALANKGLLESSYVDGHFGTKTIDAYAAYQRSLGHTGIDASGLPGVNSLRSLGDGRYTVVRPVTAGAKVSYHGETMNTRTKAMLVEAERKFGAAFDVTQGSYTTGNPSSAGTHDGGGALDLSVSGMSGTTRTNAVRALRQVGFAAWLRTPDQGNWAYHIHAVALADPDQSTGAYHQSGDYYLGKNGLANRGPDDGPAVNPKVTWEEYQRA